MKKIFAALSAMIFVSSAYAAEWTPLITASDFDGPKTDLMTAVGGIVLFLFVIVGLRYLSRIFS